MLHPNAVVKVNVKLLLSLDRDQIADDEDILGGFKGNFPKPEWDGKSLQHGVLAITNKRVIMWDRKLLQDDTVESFSYTNIRFAKNNRGAFTSDIQLNVSGNIKKFEGMTKNDAKIAADLINTQVSKLIPTQEFTTRTDKQTCPGCGTIGSKNEKYCMECGFHLK